MNFLTVRTGLSQPADRFDPRRWQTDSRGVRNCRETARDAFKVSLWTARSTPAILRRLEPRRQARPFASELGGFLSRCGSTPIESQTPPRVAAYHGPGSHTHGHDALSPVSSQAFPSRGRTAILPAMARRSPSTAAIERIAKIVEKFKVTIRLDPDGSVTISPKSAKDLEEEDLDRELAQLLRKHGHG